MLIGAEEWAILDRLARPGGWDSGATLPARALIELVANGLVEPVRDKDGRPARLTADGLDALAFRAARDGPPAPCSRWLKKAADDAFVELRLVHSELGLLRDYYLRLPLRDDRPDLTTALAEAFLDTPARRWHLQVTKEEATEVARILWLAALSGSVTARNRVARHHGVIYPSKR